MMRVFSGDVKRIPWEATVEIRFFLLWATIDALKSKKWYELSMADF